MGTALLSIQQIESGYQRFLAQDQQAMAQVEAVTQDIADALGTSLVELRHIETSRVLNARAAAKGIDCFEFLLNFAVLDESERLRIRQIQRAAIARALGES